MCILLRGGKVFANKKITTRDVVLSNGQIKLENTKSIKCDEVVNIDGLYIVPGFVDIHVHGYKGFEFINGIYDSVKNNFDNSRGAYEKGFADFTKNLVKSGVTGAYLGTYAVPIDVLENAFARLADVMDNQKAKLSGTRILGGFIEGSFINKEMCGAQNPEYVLEPEISIFKKINQRGVIKLVLVAPENPKAIDLITYLDSIEVRVGAGHCKATADDIKNAMNAGLRYFVHFLNGRTTQSFKSFDGGGAVEAVLQNDIYAELILDGIHVSGQYVREVIARKGIDRVIGITDAIFPAGTNFKTVSLGGICGQVSEKGDYIHVQGDKGKLFSSMLSMDKGFENLLNWFTSEMPGVWHKKHEEFSLEEAIGTAVQLCSKNPNDLMGRAGYGEIKDGAAADICVLNIGGKAGDYNIKVAKTFIDGILVFDSNLSAKDKSTRDD